MRKQTGIRRYFLSLLCVSASLFFAGCAQRELSKTVILEEKDDKSGENEYVVKNIKEYYYEAASRDENWIAWERGTKNIYVVSAD